MSYSYVVLGAGRQGVALAFDLAKNCEAKRVTLVDSDSGAAMGAVARLATLLPRQTSSVTAETCDASRPATTERVLRGADVAISCVPYRFNVELTRVAVGAGVHFCDLGGNTEVVRRQLDMHEAATRAGVSVVPDCGLAPGLGNLLAAHGITRLDQPEAAHVRCGGLPEQAVGPLGYKLLFNFQGLINEYSGKAEFLRDGRPVLVPTLTELEQIEFPEPIGRCEAAVTSGGTSTCPQSFLGRVRDYDYKTVRYPGHFAIIKAMFELGCFEERVHLRNGTTIEPKALLRQLMEDRLAFPDIHDVTVLRATVSGIHAGRATTLVYDLLDRRDQATGFTAMERTTSYPTALIAYMQARGLIPPGARPLERCVPLDKYVEELPRHDIRVSQRTA